jgi:hypothetical protein
MQAQAGESSGNATYAARRRGCGLAPVGARSRATGVAGLKTVFPGFLIRLW